MYNYLVHQFFSALSEERQDKLQKLVALFLAENAITNLSALRTTDACFTGNILDSLAFSLFANDADLKPGNLLIDVGTGGGFPLLPIAITHPELRCSGLEAIGKKAAAVERIAKALGLANVSLVRERSEVVGQDRKHRERFDVVTARAVAPLPVLLEYCAPLCKPGGHVVLWKSMHIDDEAKSATEAERILGLGTSTGIPYDLGGDLGTRQLLIYKKERPTPAEYPRRVGEAKHHPLGGGKDNAQKSE